MRASSVPVGGACPNWRPELCAGVAVGGGGAVAVGGGGAVSAGGGGAVAAGDGGAVAVDGGSV